MNRRRREGEGMEEEEEEGRGSTADESNWASVHSRWVDCLLSLCFASLTREKIIRSPQHIRILYSGRNIRYISLVFFHQWSHLPFQFAHWIMVSLRRLLAGSILLIVAIALLAATPVEAERDFYKVHTNQRNIRWMGKYAGRQHWLIHWLLYFIVCDCRFLESAMTPLKFRSRSQFYNRDTVHA